MNRLYIYSININIYVNCPLYHNCPDLGKSFRITVIWIRNRLDIQLRTRLMKSLL